MPFGALVLGYTILSQHEWKHQSRILRESIHGALKKVEQWESTSGVPPDLWDLMPNDLRWCWRNSSNKVSNKCNALESSPIRGNLSSAKMVPGAKAVGDRWLPDFIQNRVVHIQIYACMYKYSYRIRGRIFEIKVYWAVGNIYPSGRNSSNILFDL